MSTILFTAQINKNQSKMKPWKSDNHQWSARWGDPQLEEIRKKKNRLLALEWLNSWLKKQKYFLNFLTPKKLHHPCWVTPNGQKSPIFFSIQVEVTNHQRSSIIKIIPHPTVLTPKCSLCIKCQRILMISLSDDTSICLNNLSISFNTLTMITFFLYINFDMCV